MSTGVGVGGLSALEDVDGCGGDGDSFSSGIGAGTPPPPPPKALKSSLLLDLTFILSLSPPSPVLTRLVLGVVFLGGLEALEAAAAAALEAAEDAAEDAPGVLWGEGEVPLPAPSSSVMLDCCEEEKTKLIVRMTIAI